MKAQVRLDVPDEVVGGGGLLHQPHLLPDLGDVLLRHPLERMQEAVALEREPDRDQDLLHLLVGDSEDNGSTVGERLHEPLVLELSQRLAHRAAARPELRREGRLDQPLAWLIVAHDDRAAQDLHDLLSSRSSLAGASVEDNRRCAFDAIGHARLHHTNCRQSTNG